MLAQERYDYILDVLNKKKIVQASYLMRTFNVSGETVRRDLEYLEKEGLLKRVRGGAALVKVETAQEFFNHRATANIENKNEIAGKAVKLISEGQSIALDCSTTGLVFAHELKRHFNTLTVVTNSNEVLNELKDMNSYRIIHCGGIYNHDEHACFGSQALETIRELNIDIAFIGVGGISLREGFTESYFEGAAMLKAFLGIAQQKIVLADHTKFDKVSFINVCGINDIDLVVTDSEINQKILDKYKKNGLDII